nr:hypothetical protein [Deltaproteobacteria bacterium]
MRIEREIREAAEFIGYPLILKPIAGAGSADTYRVGDKAELDRVIPLMRGVQEASCEEYVEGEEFTFDTVRRGKARLREHRGLPPEAHRDALLSGSAR